MEARYIIKCTYLDGRHAGEEYFLRKGGYVCEADSIHWEDTTYALPNAKAICTRLNRQAARDEKRYHKLFSRCSYEPYQVQV